MRKSTSSFTRLAARWFFIGAALVLTSPRSAQAQSEREDRLQYEVFDDDLLNADVATPHERWQLPHRRGPRVMLIRPRTSFVPELYESLEHI